MLNIILLVTIYVFGFIKLCTEVCKNNNYKEHFDSIKNEESLLVRIILIFIDFILNLILISIFTVAYLIIEPFKLIKEFVDVFIDFISEESK